MIKTYTLDMSDSEDRYKSKCLDQAQDSLRVLQDLDNDLRSRIKYGELPEAEEELAENIRTKLHELLADHQVSLWIEE